MAQLVILGHKTRSKEVIEILEMLGGRNSRDYICNVPGYAYSINEQGIIDLYISPSNSSITFTLEEFLEKFPYKVGDRVNSPCKGCVKTITSMEWDTYLNTVTYKLDNRIYTNIDQLKVVNDLQPYKEEAMEKINVAKLLKDCPTGYSLDCAMYEDVYFDFVDELNIIHCYIQHGTHKTSITFNQYGTPNSDIKSKCVIYPKGKTTWEGFHRPFKDGDVIATKLGSIFIFKESSSTDIYRCYVALDYESKFIYKEQWFGHKNMCRFATEEEKEKLFKAIKDNGYKWNPETKTLEKVDEPKFHEGNWIIRNNKYTGIPVKVIGFNDYYSCELNGEVVNLTRNDVHNNFHLWTIDDAKDGDVLAINWYEGNDYWEKIIIFKKYHNKGIEELINSPCVEGYGNTFKNGKLVFHEEVPYFSKTWTANLYPATKEQCKLLFQKIKEAGYVWNAETKTLEKLIGLKFKVGDRIKSISCDKYYIIKDIEFDRYILHDNCFLRFNDEHIFELVVEPKFKVGDVIVNNYRKHLNGDSRSWKIYQITNDKYIFTDGSFMYIQDQNNWVLNTAKFDITTLKPFAEVLVRNTNNGRWHGQLYMSYNENEEYPFECVYNCWKQCIPYENNEHLFNKTDDCTDYFKTWE